MDTQYEAAVTALEVPPVIDVMINNYDNII